MHQKEFVPATTLLIPTFHRPAMLHMASGDTAADLNEVRISPYENRSGSTIINKLEIPNSVNHNALDNSSIKLPGESKKE